MKTQLQNILSCALLAIPAFVSAQDPAYDRVVELSYIRGTKTMSFNFDDQKLFQTLDEVQGGVTAVIPFLLNVPDPSSFDSTLQGLIQRNITMVPAIGEASQPKLNTKFFKDIAAGYRNYTDHIRLELLDQYTDTPNGLQEVQDLINYLTNNLNFQHIMLNPWPQVKGQGPYPFKGKAVDATILSVLLDFDRSSPFTVYPDPTNWYPPSTQRIQDLHALNPDINVLVNYENEPQMEALAALSIDQQEQAMQTTINQINSRTDNLHWTAPFSEDYNPVAIGTWDWIAQQLSKM